MQGSNDRSLNPWVSIWLKPRATIQQIIDTDPMRHVLLLAAVVGFSNTLDRASMRGLGDRFDWPVIFIAGAVVGPVFGILFLYLSSLLVSWTGRWLGGQAPLKNIRAAVAWS